MSCSTLDDFHCITSGGGDVTPRVDRARPFLLTFHNAGAGHVSLTAIGTKLTTELAERGRCYLGECAERDWRCNGKCSYAAKTN
jgi:hypothetical protein